MSLWDNENGLLGGIISGLVSTGSSMASTAMQVNASKSQQKRQYEYQRKLNTQANSLQKNINKWNAKNMPTLARQGLENAGYNPLLAVNSGANMTAGTSAQGGSSIGGQPVSSDLSGVVGDAINAYKTFHLEKTMNNQQVKLLKKQEEEINQRIEEMKARIRNLDEDTRLMKWDKPWKIIGDWLENRGIEDISDNINKFSLPNLPIMTELGVSGGIAPTPHNAMQFLKHHGSKAFWKYFDFMNDKAFYLRDKFIRHDNIPFKFYDGNISKKMRIFNGVYNYKHLKNYKPQWLNK